VKIILLKNGIQDRIITPSTSIGTNGSGSFNWTIPSTQPLGADYRVRVILKSNTAVKDVSDGRFSIVKR
jgi:hypothetical protein